MRWLLAQVGTLALFGCGGNAVIEQEEKRVWADECTVHQTHEDCMAEPGCRFLYRSTSDCPEKIEPQGCFKRGCSDKDCPTCDQAFFMCNPAKDLECPVCMESTDMVCFPVEY